MSKRKVQDTKTELNVRPEKKQKVASRKDLEQQAIARISVLSSMVLDNIINKPSMIVSSHPPLWSTNNIGIMHWDIEQHKYVSVTVRMGNFHEVCPLNHLDSLLTANYNHKDQAQFILFDLCGRKLWQYEFSQKLTVDKSLHLVGKFILFRNKEILSVFIPTIIGIDLVCTTTMQYMGGDIYALSNCHFAVFDDLQNFIIAKVDQKDGNYFVKWEIRLIKPTTGKIHLRNGHMIEENDKFTKFSVDINDKLIETSLHALVLEESCFFLVKSSFAGVTVLMHDKFNFCCTVQDRECIIPVNSEYYIVCGGNKKATLFFHSEKIYSDEKLWAKPISRHGMPDEVEYWATTFEKFIDLDHGTRTFSNHLWHIVAEYV